MLDQQRSKAQAIVIVGNGPTGYMLCRTLVSRPHDQAFRITVFGEEPRPAYDRVRLTEAFDHHSDDALSFAPRSWYEANHIELHTGDPIVEIDRLHRVVRSRSGREVKYDRLVLATGSRPFVPSVPGIDSPHVFVYRTLDDLRAIRAATELGKSAAVIGGGLLGLEAAKALNDFGIQTHVVEMASVLMPRQIDTEGAALLKKLVEHLGITVHLLRTTARVEEVGGRCRLVFKEHEPLDADFIVVSAGIRPRDELARASGLDVGPRGGIVVNDELKTSDDSIFAIGECALHRDTIYGLAAPGYHMADSVAERLHGKSVRFTGSDVSTRLKVFGIDVSFCGDYLDPSGAHVETFESENVYRKLIIRDGRLYGTICVGPSPELPRLQEAISQKRRLSIRVLNRFQKEGLLWPPSNQSRVTEWPPGAVVCSCVGVTREVLTTAVANGCRTIEAIADQTRASTVCGSCRPLLAELVGDPVYTNTGKSTSWVGLVSVMSLVFVAATILVGPLDYADSVQSSFRAVDALWREVSWRRITGFVLLGITSLTLLLSARKRLNWFRKVPYGFWRAVHTVTGLVTVLGVAIHTGLRFGHALNFLLMTVFLGANLVGGTTGVLTALETRTSGATGRWVRKWRPRLTLAHILLLWPLPILIAFHILTSYYL